MGDTSVFALGDRTCSAPANAGHRPSSLARPCSSLLLGREWLPPTSPPSDLAHSTPSDERSWWDSSMDAPHLQASRIHCVPDSSLMNLLPDFTSVCGNAQTRCPVQSIIEWRPRSARPATFPPASEYITSYNTSMTSMTSMIRLTSFSLLRHFGLCGRVGCINRRVPASTVGGSVARLSSPKTITVTARCCSTSAAG